MAIAAVTSALVLVGELDFSGQATEIEFAPEVSTVDITTFASGGYQQLVAGIRGASTTLRGLSDFAASTADSTLTLGSQYAVSVAIPGTAVGDPAHICRGLLTPLTSMSTAVGDVGKTSLAFASDGMPEARGVMLHAKTAETVTGNGTAVALTGPTASQKLWASFHVTAVSGSGTITFKVQSDDNGGFSSATDRITFSSMAAIGWTTSSVAGSFSSETHVRAQWTISGFSSVTFAAFCGIAPTA